MDKHVAIHPWTKKHYKFIIKHTMHALFDIFHTINGLEVNLKASLIEGTNNPPQLTSEYAHSMIHKAW